MVVKVSEWKSMGYGITGAYTASDKAIRMRKGMAMQASVSVLVQLFCKTVVLAFLCIIMYSKVHSFAVY